MNLLVLMKLKRKYLKFLTLHEKIDKRRTHVILYRKTGCLLRIFLESKSSNHRNIILIQIFENTINM